MEIINNSETDSDVKIREEVNNIINFKNISNTFKTEGKSELLLI